MAVFCSRSQWPNRDDWGLRLVYLLHQDNVALLTILSPLEAHKSHTIVYSIFRVDCGFDNAIFAAIELDFSKTTKIPLGKKRIKHKGYFMKLGECASGECTLVYCERT